MLLHIIMIEMLAVKILGVMKKNDDIAFWCLKYEKYFAHN